MRKLWLLLLLCAWSRSVNAQFGQPTKCTPAGYTLSESFGDSGNLCWSGGPSSCNLEWAVGSGNGSQSIVASPAGAPQYSACANSLEIQQPAGTPVYLYAPLPTASAPAPRGDVYFTVYVSSQSLASGDLVGLFALSNAPNGNNSPLAQVNLKDVSGTLVLICTSSTASKNIPISTGAWHTVHFHLTGGTSSSIQLDGGTAQTFTEKGNNATYITVGSGHASGGTNPDALTYYVGNVKVDLPGSPNCAVNTYPSAFVDFESGSLGMSPTTTTLGTDTHGGNGTWVLSTSPANYFQYQRAGQLSSLRTPIDTCGTWYTGTGSLGLEFLMSGTINYGGYIRYKPATFAGNVASAGFFWQAGNIASNDTHSYDLGNIGSSGSDSIAVYEQGNGTTLRLWAENRSTKAHCKTASNINVTSGTIYWITMQYVAGGTNSLAVYKAPNWVQVGSTLTCGNSGNSPPQYFEIGKSGSEVGLISATWYYDNWQMNWTDGKFPLGP